MKKLSKKVAPYTWSVWTEFTPLSQKHEAINLGQGFPGWPCPDFVKEALIAAVNSDQN